MAPHQVLRCPSVRSRVNRGFSHLRTSHLGWAVGGCREECWQRCTGSGSAWCGAFAAAATQTVTAAVPVLTSLESSPNGKGPGNQGQASDASQRRQRGLCDRLAHRGWLVGR